MTTMLAVTIAAFVAVGYLLTERALVNELDTTLEREVQAFSAAVRGAPQEETLAQATRTYLAGRSSSGGGQDVVLLVSLSSGRTISNSRVRLEDAPGNSVLTSPPASAIFSRVYYRGVSYRTLTTPLFSAGRPVGALQVAVSRELAERTAARVAWSLSAAGLLSLALGLPLSYAAARGALRPLRQIAADAETFSFAQPGRRITHSGPPDELGSLADTLNEMLDRLERAHADQRRFVADASHELRTPLSVIRGNVDLMRSGFETAEEERESLDMIEDEVVRMTRLLEELLTLARYESARRPQLQALEVKSLLDEVRAQALTLADRQFVVSGPSNLWVEGDLDLLHRALMNLVRNAIAHTVVGGRILLECSVHGESVALAVEDDGAGIPEVDLERIFDRFYRSRDARSSDGGAGLGLSIVRRIVELHEGRIKAGNVQPHGARFTIELPAAPSPPDAIAAP